MPKARFTVELHMYLDIIAERDDYEGAENQAIDHILEFKNGDGDHLELTVADVSCSGDVDDADVDAPEGNYAQGQNEPPPGGSRATNESAPNQKAGKA